MSDPDMSAQRDQALACMVLAAGTALAVLLSVFGAADRTAIANARKAVAAHELLWQQSVEALAQNQKALDETRAVLAARHGQGR